MRHRTIRSSRSDQLLRVRARARQSSFGVADCRKEKHSVALNPFICVHVFSRASRCYIDTQTDQAGRRYRRDREGRRRIEDGRSTSRLCSRPRTLVVQLAGEHVLSSPLDRSHRERNIVFHRRLSKREKNGICRIVPIEKAGTVQFVACSEGFAASVSSERVCT